MDYLLSKLNLYGTNIADVAHSNPSRCIEINIISLSNLWWIDCVIVKIRIFSFDLPFWLWQLSDASVTVSFKLIPYFLKNLSNIEASYSHHVV